mmetsp:Transcript_141672/g.353237  ORF Transcript_141672/g.353237 Transcript_141672/m.353237 type:complete len:208 (-) Transcript_141672:461-1084(-)
MIAQVAIVDKIKDAVKFIDFVLNWRAGESDTGVSNCIADLLDRLGHLGAMVLDALSFIDDHAGEGNAINVAELCAVIADDVVCREDDVETCPFIGGEPALQAMVHVDVKMSGPFCKLLLPISQKTRRHDDERGSRTPMLILEQISLTQVDQQGDGLQCLAQAHVVSQNRPQAITGKSGEPLETSNLIGSQVRLQACGRRDVPHAVQA